MLTKLIREKYMFACLLLGVLLIFDYGITNQIFTNIREAFATTLLSVGIIGLVVDFMVRRQLQDEMIRLVGLQGAVVSNRIADVGSVRDMNWEALLTQGTKFRFVLSDTESWIVDGWQYIEKRAEAVAIELEVYLPKPDGAYIENLSRKNGHKAERLSDNCQTASERIEGLWGAMRRKVSVKPGARISIYYLDDMPMYSVASSDFETHIFIDSPTKKDPARPSFRISFSGGLSDEPISRFHHELGVHAPELLSFENKVEK